MNNQIQTINNTLHIDLEKRINKILKETCVELTEEIQDAYVESIKQFYLHKAFYNKKLHSRTNKPRYYKRTYSLYAASDAYGGGYNIKMRNIKTQKGTNNFRAGIEVSSRYIPGNPYGNKTYNIYSTTDQYHQHKITSKSVDKEWVFERSFYEGIHGYYKAEQKGAFGNYDKSNVWEYIRSYRLYQGIKIHQPPSKMNPSPKQLMDRKFNQITSKKAINSKISKNISKYL